MDSERLRAWWWHRQALDGRLLGKASDEILKETGWARSVGGAGPYVTLYSRGRVSRLAADAAVKTLAIHELPSARGCTYVVPSIDYALALRVGQPFNDLQMKSARSLGVTDQEIERLCMAVLAVLDQPLDPAALRKATGGAARSLGEAGKKKGLSTTLPLALGRLQAHGEIRRIPTNGRLDQQRYRYARWRSNPLQGASQSAEEAHTALARRYFYWAAPATLEAFQWFSGLGVRASAAAVKPLGLVPLGANDPRLLLPHQLEALRDWPLSSQPQYQLVSSLDALFLLRRDVQSHLDANTKQQLVLVGNSRKELGALTDLPSHAIVDRGRLVGLWEYDIATDAIVWMAFDEIDDALRLAVTETESFIHADLGDARSFGLDSPQRRAPRIAALRSIGPSGDDDPMA